MFGGAYCPSDCMECITHNTTCVCVCVCVCVYVCVYIHTYIHTSLLTYESADLCTGGPSGYGTVCESESESESE